MESFDLSKKIDARAIAQKLKMNDGNGQEPRK